jgi:hypothetical protein
VSKGERSPDIIHVGSEMIASKVAEFSSSVVSTTVSSETPPDPNVVEAPQAESQFFDITEFAKKLDDRFFFYSDAE